MSRRHVVRIPDMGISKRACQEFTLFGKNEYLRASLLEGVILPETWRGGGGKPLDASCGFKKVYLFFFHNRITTVEPPLSGRYGTRGCP